RGVADGTAGRGSRCGRHRSGRTRAGVCGTTHNWVRSLDGPVGMARMIRVPVQVDGRQMYATVVREGRRAWVHLAGRVFVIEPDDSGPRRGGSAADHDALTSPMPATVTRINVSAGDAVSDGDVILLLEAM